MDTIKFINENLPNGIWFEGIYFKFEIFMNGTDVIRLCYKISEVSDASPHKEKYDVNRVWENKFLDNSRNSFLWLWENISRDEDLLLAAINCYIFLSKNNLIKDKSKGYSDN